MSWFRRTPRARQVSYIKPNEKTKNVRESMRGKLERGDEFELVGHYEAQTWLERLLRVPKKRRIYRVEHINKRHMKVSFDR